MWIDELKRDLSGSFLEVWEGRHPTLTEAQTEAYRKLWRQRAGVEKPVPKPISESTTTCDHPDPALCHRLKKHIYDRLWEIWNGINIDPKDAQKYRSLWEKQAKLGRLSTIEPKKRDCGCRGNKNSTKLPS